jgi:hypothetical protein
VATGKAHVLAAAASAESAARHSPGLRRHIFCDASSLHLLRPGLFDSTGEVDDPHARSKIDYLPRTPFERTLYLDADTRVVHPVEDVFRLLDRFDIAMAHAPRRNSRETRETWRVDLPDAFPQVNSGVIAFRRTPDVLDLLQDWSEAYREGGFKKDQVTLREVLWLSDLRLAILPPEYNIKHRKYVDSVWESWEAVPRILHLRSFVSRPPRVKTWHDKLPWGLRQAARFGRDFRIASRRRARRQGA